LLCEVAVHLACGAVRMTKVETFSIVRKLE